MLLIFEKYLIKIIKKFKFKHIEDKKTPFYSFHSNLGAQLVSFAGYMMPIKYKGINFEHNFVRSNVGVFDVSHMAQITIKGNHASELVQLLTTNDIDKLINGKVQYLSLIHISEPTRPY